MKDCWSIAFKVSNELIYFVDKGELFSFEREFDRAKIFFHEIAATSYLSDLQRLNPNIPLFKKLIVVKNSIEMRN